VHLDIILQIQLINLKNFHLNWNKPRILILLELRMYFLIYSLILSRVETTCHNNVRMWDCICGFWVTLSNILMVFAALTEMDPLFSSFIPVKISLTIFRIFFWILLFLAILSKVLIAFASLSWFSLSLISFFEAIDVNILHFFYLTKQWLLNVFPIA